MKFPSPTCHYQITPNVLTRSWSDPPRGIDIPRFARTGKLSHGEGCAAGGGLSKNSEWLVGVPGVYFSVVPARSRLSKFS